MNEVLEFNKNDPKVSRLVRLCCPDYRGRRTVKITAKKTYHLFDYWDGGSRQYAYLVHLPSHQLVGLESVQYEQQKDGNPLNLRIGKVKITPEIVVVENVIFMGKDLGVRIYVHPEVLKSFQTE